MESFLERLERLFSLVRFAEKKELAAGQSTKGLVSGLATQQCCPSWALAAGHLCGSSSSWLIRMSRNLFPLSSIQKNNILGGKAFVVLRVKTQRIDRPAVVTMGRVVQKVAEGHGKRRAFALVI